MSTSSHFKISYHDESMWKISFCNPEHWTRNINLIPHIHCTLISARELLPPPPERGQVASSSGEEEVEEDLRPGLRLGHARIRLGRDVVAEVVEVVEGEPRYEFLAREVGIMRYLPLSCIIFTVSPTKRPPYSSQRQSSKDLFFSVSLFSNLVIK